MKLVMTQLNGGPSAPNLVGLSRSPFLHLGTHSGNIILPVIGTPAEKKLFKITEHRFGQESKVVYDGPDVDAAADAYARASREQVRKQLLGGDESQKITSLQDLFSGILDMAPLTYSAASYVDPLPDGSFKLEQPDGSSGKPKIIAGADDSDTGLVVFQLFNDRGIMHLGDEDKRLKPVAAEASIRAGHDEDGHVLIFSMKQGDEVFLADPDGKKVYHCTWNDGKVDIKTYTEKQFIAFASISPNHVPALPPAESAGGASDGA